MPTRHINLADLVEEVIDAVPDREALYCEGRRLTFRQLDERANRLAHHFALLGVGAGGHVGCHMMNGTEYVETMLALFKLRAVPVNVNYRYVEEELRYLYDDADLVGVVFDADFADRVVRVAPKVELLQHFVVVGQADDDELPPGTVRYEEALAAQPADRSGFPERSEDDLFLIYTGGTTGMPKGVMWRQEDLFYAGMFGGYPSGDPVTDPLQAGPRAAANSPMVSFPVAPLMHGAAELGTFINLLGGGKVVLIRKYSGDGVLRLIEQEKVNTVTIVGDAMAVPLVEALEAGHSYDLSSWFALASAGALLSQPMRDALTRHLPNLLVIDNFGSSETGYNGTAPPGAKVADGLRFSINERTQVLGDDLRPLAPGSGEMGWVAQRGHIPLGYYNDPVKTARTFVEVDGERWVLPGDMARVDADGTMRFLGRGSVCINSGGEKIYPEEVEAALKTHPAVLDAVVAGVPDERWGQRVAAVLQVREGSPSPTQADLEEHLATQLARYKVPRVVTVVDTIQRSPSGKADYGWAARVLQQAPGVSA